MLPQAGFTEDLRVPEFDLSPALVRQMFVLLRTSYEFVVVDLGHAFSDAQIEAVRLSNVVLLPVVADVPGLRRVRWALDTAESLGISRDRFQIVLNRYGGKNQVAKAKVEEALHTSVLTTIADHGPLFTAAPQRRPARGRVVRQRCLGLQCVGENHSAATWREYKHERRS